MTWILQTHLWPSNAEDNLPFCSLTIPRISWSISVSYVSVQMISVFCDSCFILVVFGSANPVFLSRFQAFWWFTPVLLYIIHDPHYFASAFRQFPVFDFGFDFQPSIFVFSSTLSNILHPFSWSKLCTGLPWLNFLWHFPCVSVCFYHNKVTLWTSGYKIWSIIHLNAPIIYVFEHSYTNVSVEL